MIDAEDIKQKLSAVAKGELSLEDFGDWLDSESWNMHADSKLHAIEMASAASLLFSEYGLGYRDEVSLRRELLAIPSNNISFNIRFDEHFNAEIQPRSAFNVSWLFASPHPQGEPVALLQPA